MKVNIDVDLMCKSSDNLKKAFDDLNIKYKYHGETFPFSRSGHYSFKCTKNDKKHILKYLKKYEYYIIKEI
jgi:hypothetical protein